MVRLTRLAPVTREMCAPAKSLNVRNDDEDVATAVLKEYNFIVPRNESQRSPLRAKLGHSRPTIPL